MCLGVPGKVIEINEEKIAQVDFGGIKREVSCQLINEDIEVGDYILVHVGYAISKMDEKEAKETLSVWKELDGQLPV